MRKLILFVLTGALLFWAFGAVTAKEILVKNQAKQDSLQRAVFKVENLTCGACFSKINAGLTPLEGFSGMGANLFRSRVAVDFVGALSADKIKAAITQTGYPATLESVEPITSKASFAYLNTSRKGKGSGGCCSGGSEPVASQTPAGSPGTGLPTGGFGCTLPGNSLPGGAQRPPVTTN